LAKNHVKGIIIVGVTQPGKKLTSSTLLEFPEEDKLDGVVLLGFTKKKSTLLAQMVLLSKFPLKTGSVQVVLRFGERTVH
jgi:hypothetical protein